VEQEVDKVEIGKKLCRENTSKTNTYSTKTLYLFYTKTQPACSKIGKNHSQNQGKPSESKIARNCSQNRRKRTNLGTPNRRR